MVILMKYLIERVFKMNYKNLFEKINLIHLETDKSKITIFMDIVYTGIRFKAGYMDYFLLKMYEMTNKEKATYLVRGLNSKLVKTLNKKEDIHLLNNKIETNKLLKDYLKRDWSYLDDKDIDKFLKKHSKFIAKPSDGQCGKGIEIIEVNKFKDLTALKQHLKKNNLDLLEEIVKQHKSIDKINSSSVNTIRIVTIYNDKLFLIGACFRIGNNNFVDNFESGGMTAKVNVDKGIVLSPAVDKKENIYYKHPVSKQEIVGFKFPYYKETIKMINKMSLLVPTIKYIGWDIAITNNGPVLIEANPLPGSQITQMPYPNGKKEGCLPKIKEALAYRKEE